MLYFVWLGLRKEIISPARFYVSVVMKMILSRFILDYEFKLADPEARLYFKLGKARLPSPFMSILVRKRERICVVDGYGEEGKVEG